MVLDVDGHCESRYGVSWYELDLTLNLVLTLTFKISGLYFRSYKVLELKLGMFITLYSE